MSTTYFVCPLFPVCEILEGRQPDNAMDSEELFNVAAKELPATGFAEYF